MTPDRLTPNPKVVLNIINVHKADKEVTDLKPTILAQKKKMFSYIPETLLRPIKRQKCLQKKHKVYLKTI